jgi:predicted nucleic acid-binding protein
VAKHGAECVGQVALSDLIDTNALSELKTRRPHPGVARWFETRPASLLHVSVLTLGELRKGIEAMTDEARRVRFLDWLESDLPQFFVGRILPIDRRIADRWGRLCAIAARPLPAIDSLLAATAIEHGLTLVTRNVADFSPSGPRVVNPWTTPARS